MSITLFSKFLWHPLNDLEVKPPDVISFLEDIHTQQQILLSLLNLDKVLKNSTPGKVVCIWHIEQVQIGAMKIMPT